MLSWVCMGSAGFPRRQQTLVLWLARLALLVYVFQIGAIDHWHANPESTHSLAGNQLHAAHCHSATANCADSSSLTGSLHDVSLIPLLPPAQAQTVAEAPASPNEAAIATPHQPPRLSN